MIYGLYRSAAGIITATHREGVIADNLANVESVGFKRDLALVQQRRTGAQELPGLGRFSDGLLDRIGGGQLLSPTVTDRTQGTLEGTGNPYDAAIVGRGYFVVEKGGKQFLTRNGSFILNNKAELVLADGSGARVLGKDLAPLQLNPLAQTEIGPQGEIIQNAVQVGQLAIRDADDRSTRKVGGNLLEVSAEAGEVKDLPVPESFGVRGGSVERSNVDPATELGAMMAAQRELDANANVLRYQDQTLGRLVNDVGKIS